MRCYSDKHPEEFGQKQKYQNEGIIAINEPRTSPRNTEPRKPFPTKHLRTLQSTRHLVRALDLKGTLIC